VIFSVLLPLSLFIHFLLLKREIKSIIKQLNQYNHDVTNKKITISLLDRDLEVLATEINNHMEQLVLTRTEKKHSENELKQAIANMSHDLRTPLTAIMGYIQLLESNSATEIEKKEYISIAKNRTKRLQTLLDDFFDLSVIESADYQLRLEKVKINQIVMEVIAAFYDPFYERQIEPILHVPEQNLSIYTDSQAVKRVIENLVSNAIKYAQQNVTIRLEQSPSSVQLTVSNDAKSLTQNDVEKLFDRFYMADQNRLGKGTGLGLSIAKNLMLKMDGNLQAVLQEEQLHMICEWRIK
jgi:signal transduction histidine kinase